MEQGYLIDTNVIIDFSENRLPNKAKSFIASIIDTDPYFSVINKIELLGFSIVNDAIVEMIETATIIDLTDAIVHKTITIRKTNPIKLPDAIIAATAIEYGLKLVTRNMADFQNINELAVINPWD